MQGVWCQFLLALGAGYLFSLGVGAVFVYFFHKGTKHLTDKEAKRNPIELLAAGWSSVVTGTLERAVFTLLFMVRPEETVVAMGAWLTMKMAATWSRDAPLEIEDKLAWISHALLSLQTGLLSMVFAAMGGVIARLVMHWPVIPGWTPTG